MAMGLLYGAVRRLLIGSGSAEIGTRIYVPVQRRLAIINVNEYKLTERRSYADKKEFQ
uniref:Uncharacterized protein n=1 Tax=uncultured bacterium 246 TaxID=698384 RepID=E3T6D1_9BACT|nr:hypothetical protein [uncultured bacterium 246]